MKKMKVLVGLLVVSLALFFCGCGKTEGKIEMTEGASIMKEKITYQQITQEEAKRLMETEKDYVIIDARTEEECKHCFVIRHCTCCAQKIDNGDSLSREMKLHLCEIEKRRAKEKIRQYIFYKYFLLQDTDEGRDDYDGYGSIL